MFFFKSFIPRWALFLFDIFIVFFSIVVAYLSRFNFNIPSQEYPLIYYSVVLILLIRASMFALFGTYRYVVRYTSTQDALLIGLSLLTGSLLMALLNLIWYYFFHFNLIPYSIILIEFNISLVFLLGYRIVLKMAYLENKIPTREKQSVLIFGAGESGVIAKRAIERDAGTKFKIFGFLDEDKKKIGNKIEGILVYPLEKLSEILSHNEIKFIIIAIQDLKPSKKKLITEIALQHNTKVLIVPPISTWINGELSFKQIKKIPIEELLERDEIKISNAKVYLELNRKTILITGAAGSIGSELVRQVLKFDPKRVVCVDIAETPMFYLQDELKKSTAFQKCEFILANILDENKMYYIFEKYQPHIVFHAAAYKHVPLMEEAPYEAFKVNVLGTKIIADLALKVNVEKFVFISTDKAVNPVSVMGASKRMAEMYIQALNNAGKTLFMSVRFGNVLGSNGSVIPLFRKQIESGGPITITDPEATRYFMTIPEACLLVLEAVTMGKGGEIFMLNMGEPIKIIDLAKKMIKLSGLELGKDIQIQITGLRPGEKLHEELLADKEKSIPTYHESIVIAQHRQTDHEQIKKHISELEYLLSELNEQHIYNKIREWIPEFNQNNESHNN
ncbi:MAG: polysaccharide biosynthesis protein [Bacteroidales bacterium]|nr:polysaccharide biosynthesis protein [Bacteroidales bacterium]